jgi:hypothetical protein
MDSPPDEVRLIVAAWVIGRFDDPYQGMNREPGFANLWYGRIPGTVFKGNVVTCSYWIEATDWKVRCNAFATLRYPA